MTAHVQTILAIIVSTVMLGGLIWKRLAPVVEMTRMLHGEDGDSKRGITDRPGILERQTKTEQMVATQATEIAELRSMLAEVVGQLRNNGGSSLRDKVDRTLEAVTSGNTAQAAHALQQAA